MVHYILLPTFTAPHSAESAIEEMRNRLATQEGELRDALLNEELQKLHQRFRENEAALRRSHQRAASAAAGAAQSAPPVAYNVGASVLRETVERNPRPVIARASQATDSRRPNNTDLPRRQMNPPRPRAAAPRPNPQPMRPSNHLQAAADKFDIGGFNDESELFINNLNANRNYQVDVANVNSIQCQPLAQVSGQSLPRSLTPDQAQPCSSDRVISGITVRHVKKVKRTLNSAHSALPNDYSTEYNVAFSDLEFRRLVAGEIEIILEYQPSQVELKGRLNLLRTMAHLLGSYPWPAVRNVNASVLREIEQVKLDWSSDINTTMHFSLIMCPGNATTPQVVDSRAEKHGRASSGKKGGGACNGSGDSRVWFCAEYQKNQCAHKEAHQRELYGKQVVVQHVCAKCLLKDRRELKHPDSSAACPHFSE